MQHQTHPDRLGGLGAAINDASRAGLLLNDPITRARRVSDFTASMLADARTSVRWLTKGFDDEVTARSLASAGSRGVDTRLVSSAVGRESADMLRSSDAAVVLAPAHAQPSRINLLVVDDEVGLLSTSYPISSVLHPGANGSTAGRESALVLRGDALRQVVDGARSTPPGAAAFGPRDRAAPSAVTGFRLLGSSGRYPLTIIDHVH